MDDDDGALTIETVLGYTYGVDDLIAAEAKERFVAMATLARRSFGYYSTVVDGEHVDLSVYDLCVQAYQERDGSGWQSMVSRQTGISRQVIHKRQVKARQTWQRWNGMESEE